MDDDLCSRYGRLRPVDLHVQELRQLYVGSEKKLIGVVNQCDMVADSYAWSFEARYERI